jgi:hypothetical protein
MMIDPLKPAAPVTRTTACSFSYAFICPRSPAVTAMPALQLARSLHGADSLRSSRLLRGRLFCQSAMPQGPSVHQEEEDRDENQDVNGRCNHPCPYQEIRAH